MTAIAEEERRLDALLSGLLKPIPYARFLGISFERRGDELTSRLSFADELIGNPFLPALHGGAVGAFLEITAIVELAWESALERLHAGGEEAEAILRGEYGMRPKPVDITVDYLRSGRPRDTHARALVLRRGRRIANVRVEAWQEARSRPIAAAHGHFLLASGASS